MSMIQNYSSSETGNLGDDCGVCDLLSDLSLDIIHIILAFIPIEEAVRTSVLSTRWRYTWTTLPHLEFDGRCASRENKSEYEKFITRVLFRHKGPIHKFKVSSWLDNFPILDEWIFCLARNDIRELDLDPVDFGLLEMRSNIYSCKKLTNLRLFYCELDPPPLHFKGFLFLRFLSLGYLSLSPDEIYSLVDVCPLLERFELTEMGKLELKISAPNLKYMLLKGRHKKICINAPLLTEISVQLSLYKIGPDQQLKSSACEYASCFAGFTNLQKLSGYGYFTKYLSLGIELCHHSLVFHRLKLIHLYTVNSKNAKEMMVVAHLVIGAPNLQELKIGCKNYKSDSEAPHLSFRDLGCPSNFKSEKLTDVSVRHVSSLTLEVEFLKFLLESSPALVTMRVELLLNDTEENRNNLRDKLKEECNLASPTAKLRIQRTSFYY